MADPSCNSEFPERLDRLDLTGQDFGRRERGASRLVFLGVAGACALGVGAGLWARPALSERRSILQVASIQPLKEPSPRLQIVLDEAPIPLGDPLEVMSPEHQPAQPALAPLPPELLAPARPPAGLLRVDSPAEVSPPLALAPPASREPERRRPMAPPVGRPQAETRPLKAPKESAGAARRAEKAKADRAARDETAKVEKAKAAKAKTAKAKTAKAEPSRTAATKGDGGKARVSDKAAKLAKAKLRNEKAEKAKPAKTRTAKAKARSEAAPKVAQGKAKASKTRTELAKAEKTTKAAKGQKSARAEKAAKIEKAAKARRARTDETRLAQAAAKSTKAKKAKAEQAKAKLAQTKLAKARLAKAEKAKADKLAASLETLRREKAQAQAEARAARLKLARVTAEAEARRKAEQSRQIAAAKPKPVAPRAPARADPGPRRVAAAPRCGVGDVVCADPSLTAVDRRLTRAYNAAEAAGVSAAELRRQQRRWLAARETAAREAPWAVRDVYDARIAELDDLTREARYEDY